MTEIEAKRITTLIVAAYPGWRPSEATMQLYERLIMPLPAPTTEQAVMEIICSDREFAPAAGTICRQAARLALAGAGQPAAGAEEAWAQVQAAVRRRGVYRAPHFDHPVLARTVAALDWREICTNPNSEATRAHFFRLFSALEERVVATRLFEMRGGAQCGRLSEGWEGRLGWENAGGMRNRRGGEMTMMAVEAGRGGRRMARKKATPWDEALRQDAVQALGRMVIPDAVLSSQILPAPLEAPELDLLRALLISALEEFIDSYRPSATARKAEERRINRQIAESWFAGDPGAAVDFEICCALFGFSADQMRKQIARLKALLTAQSN